MAVTYSNAALTTISGATGGVPSGLYPTPVPDWLDRVKNRNTPLLQMITKASAPESTHNLLTWGYSSPRETFDTLAEALDNSETGVDVDHASYYQIGDVIKIEDELMLVTGISSPTLTVIRGFAGTSAATHTDDYGISILGPAYRQNQDTERTPIAQGEKLTNNWQQFEFKLDASHARQIFPTFENLGKGDALRYFAKRLMQVEAPHLLEKTLIHGVANDEDATEPSTMNGILTTTYTSNVDTISGALTAKQLMNSLEDTFLASHEPIDLTMMGHPRMIRRVSSFFAGMRRMDANDTQVTLHVEKIVTPFGTLNMVSNPNWLKPGAAAATPSQELDQLIIFNPKDVELVPASKDSVWNLSYRDVPYNNSWQEVAFLRGMYSIRMKNPFTRTILKGFSVTDSDYPGMI
jgi:hypothetical protein